MEKQTTKLKKKTVNPKAGPIVSLEDVRLDTPNI
jgi:hypothetical protein